MKKGESELSGLYSQKSESRTKVIHIRVLKTFKCLFSLQSKCKGANITTAMANIFSIINLSLSTWRNNSQVQCKWDVVAGSYITRLSVYYKILKKSFRILSATRPRLLATVLVETTAHPEFIN